MSRSMFEVLDDDLLHLLQARIQHLKGQVLLLEQAKRRERGAYIKPELTGSTYEFEQSLLRSYQELFEGIVASLRGANDDVTTGRLEQARVPEVEQIEALDYWDVSEAEREHPIDRTKLAAILALLLLWRSRHTRRAELHLDRFFEQGRQAALSEIGVETVAAPASNALRGTVLGRYRDDLGRLERALREGNPRSKGVEWIVQNADTLGEALALLRRLRDSERFRIEMFAESLAWTAWSEGYRAGAVEGTVLRAKELGLVTSAGLSLSALTEEERLQLPHYVWVGPDDERTCDPCRNQFGEPIIAFSLDDLPDPQSICRYGRACRHWFELFTE